MYRDPDNCRGQAGGGIEEWLQGKTHPLRPTEPLHWEELSLPAGSLVCLNSHAAHAVSPTAAWRTQPRLAMSFFYFKVRVFRPPDAVDRHASTRMIV
jgi:hypothetical protein